MNEDTPSIRPRLSPSPSLSLFVQVADVASVFTDTLSNRLSQLTEVPPERLSVDMATPPLTEDNEKDNVTVEVVIAKGDQPSAAEVLAKLEKRYPERLRMGRFGNNVRIIGLDGKVQDAPAEGEQTEIGRERDGLVVMWPAKCANVLCLSASVEEPLVPGDGGDSPVLPIGLPVIFGRASGAQLLGDRPAPTVLYCLCVCAGVLLSAFIIMVALICGGWCMCRRCKGKARLLQSADDSSSKASHSSWVQARSATGSTSASSRATSRRVRNAALLETWLVEK